ncbi:MAG: OmpH family outer membrane protein [Akkermansiaceae bacterium]
MSISLRRMITVAAAAFAIANAAAQEAKLKVATVDMSQLFKEFYQTNIAQQEINVERARIQKDNNEKLTTIRQIETDIRTLKQQSEDPSLSDKKKADVYKEYQAKYQEGIQLDKERREFLGRKDKALNEKMVQRMRGILDEIRKLVEERAKAENYDFVFDKSGMSTSQVPILLYSKDATDITPSLLKELNKNAPVDAKPVEGAPTPDEALKPKDGASDATGGQ